MAHTNVLIEPYPVCLVNLLCRLLLVKLSIHGSLTMRTLTIYPVKFISQWLYMIEILLLQSTLKVQKRISPVYPLMTFLVKIYLIFRTLLSGISRLCVVCIILLQNLARLFFWNSEILQVIFSIEIFLITVLIPMKWKLSIIPKNLIWWKMRMTMQNTAQLGFVGILRISTEHLSRMEIGLPSLILLSLK